MKAARIAVGLAFWCGLLAAPWLVAAGNDGRTQSAIKQLLASLWSSYTHTARLQIRVPESCVLSPGDPVFVADDAGSVRQIGIVLSCRASENSFQSSKGFRTIQAALFPSAPPLRTPITAHYFSTPDSTVWIAQSLLPPERRRQIEEELAGAFNEHREEIMKALQPTVDRSVRQALAVLEQDLPLALERHQPELQLIMAREKEEILRRELLPLLKDEVWPVIRRDSEPLLRQVTGELWERASIWSLAWRGAADKMPLLRGRSRLETELLRFLDQEGIPTCQRHENDFLVLLETVVQDVAANERVKTAFKEIFARASRDPEFQQLVNEIFHEVVLHNPHLWQSLRESLTSKEAQDAVRLTGAQMEPTIRRIGELIIGSRKGGLTPEFNQILRQQILLKDRHSVVIGTLPPDLCEWPFTVVEASLSGPTS